MAKKNSKATEKTKPIKKELPMEDSDSQEESEERQSFDYVEEGENGFTFDEDPTMKMPQFVNGKVVFNGLESDEDDEKDGSDEEEESEDENMNDFEREALEEEEKEEQMKKEAEANIQEDLENQHEMDKEMSEIVHGDDEEIVTDVSALKGRIQDVVSVLSDFRNKRDPSISRQEYKERLIKDCAKYYGYTEELAELFLDMFSPAEAIEWFEANESDRPVVIRTNTLKTKRKDLAQALLNRGVSLDPLGDWTKVGLKIYDTPVPIGATPEYLAGHYMLQSAASFLPVLALDPKPNERILDMCSAPGGKTSYICQLMKNTGVVIANDINKDRLVATVANIHRMGITNCAVSNYSGTDFPAIMGGFDRVLLDAPCSGLGVVSRDKNVKLTRTLKEVEANSSLQKRLILAAIDSVDANSKTGGVIVYSTCSVTVLENEAVVNYALRKRFVKLVDINTEIPFGKPGMVSYKQMRFHPTLNKTKRFYPHVNNTDGFYVAKLVKYSNTIRKTNEEEEEEDLKKDLETFKQLTTEPKEEEEEEQQEEEMEVEEETKSKHHPSKKDKKKVEKKKKSASPEVKSAAQLLKKDSLKVNRSIAKSMNIPNLKNPKKKREDTDTSDDSSLGKKISLPVTKDNVVVPLPTNASSTVKKPLKRKNSFTSSNEEEEEEQPPVKRLVNLDKKKSKSKSQTLSLQGKKTLKRLV